MRWPWRTRTRPELTALEQHRLELRREHLEAIAHLAPCCQPNTREMWRPGGAIGHTRTGDCMLRPMAGEPGYVPADG